MNNIVEQDHRFIKRRVNPGWEFGSYPTAWRTIQGYETMNMIRKGQIEGAEKGNIVAQILAHRRTKQAAEAVST